MKLAAIILTKDEERDLPGCLQSLQAIASEVYVVDSGSTDATREIAQRAGARFLSHPFTNHAAQLNWALDNVPSETDWILRIDADERLSPQLQAELAHRLAAAPPDVAGFACPRLTRFLGRAIRWGDTYPVWLVRVWRRGAGRCEDTWMDEHIVLAGPVERLKGDVIHEIPKSLSEWTRKHDWYADRECKDILSASANSQPLTGQPGVRRALKQGVYLKLPLFARAFLYWFYRYFLKLGILDGKEGLIYHFLHAFWYRFLVDAKLLEINKDPSQKSSAAISQRP